MDHQVHLRYFAVNQLSPHKEFKNAYSIHSELILEGILTSTALFYRKKSEPQFTWKF